MNQITSVKSAIRVYIPFKTHKTISFRKKILKDTSWNKNPLLDTRFYLKYIDRIFNKESIYSDCFVAEKNLDNLNFVYTTFAFSISKARIFSFDTSVAFLELNIILENTDFFQTESINHLLRQSNEENLCYPCGEKTSLNLITQEILLPYGKITHFDHISSNGATRPELFVTVVTEPLEDIETHAYHLANGLKGDSDGEPVDCDFYSNFNHIKWAITKRGVCNVGIITNNEYNDSFINNNWIEYTNSRYIIWYILALHQKYALFQYLNDIAEKNSARQLGIFQKKIMMLNTKYRFSLVSEETSYQKIYEIMCRIKNLKFEFEDADEEVERIFEYNEARSNKNNAIAMAMISILCAFSAVKDFYELLITKNCSDGLVAAFMSMPYQNRIIIGLFIIILLFSFLILLPRHKIVNGYNKVKKKIMRLFFK